MTIVWIFVAFQALMLAEQEKSSLQERLASIQRELEAAITDHERLRRELEGRIEQQQASIMNLQVELKNFRTQFQEAS